MKRTLTILLILLSLAAAIFGLYLYNQNPNAPKHAAARDTLIKFYDLYVTSAERTGEFFPDGNPQLVIHYRFWYGDIQSYRIVKIRDIDHPKQKSISDVPVKGKQKEALVEVMVKGKSSPYMDTVTLELIEGKWLIVDYWSTSQEDGPKMP
ncbi:hypothetical protein GK047_25865 [Paenibacillus sp. SYP-B3998]|uniref:Uncharacterized protein n=1 Tax=Paenibacillus sp. SYP-B3998 TaxID=2678564 RepID=A0A6G4A4R0_9BACL|nr:hypothetical protein [Paenibacillus sp. SYP-B3998]NEW09375.1 hypothetical protein [Paenibacillus sp. SYP-B3998]